MTHSNPQIAKTMKTHQERVKVGHENIGVKLIIDHFWILEVLRESQVETDESIQSNRDRQNERWRKVETEE